LACSRDHALIGVSDPNRIPTLTTPGVLAKQLGELNEMTRVEIVRELQAARDLMAEGEFNEADLILKRVLESVAEDKQRKGEHL
jgi:hypothetical protein